MVDEPVVDDSEVDKADTGEAGSGGLTRGDVAEVAALALLELTDAELDEFTGQLGAVLEHARDIEALDVSGVEPTYHPYPVVNVFRDDVVEEVDVHDDALAMAPEAEDGQFRVPPALGEEP